MLLKDLVATGVDGLLRSKSRSLLTTLGVIIGVGSVVLMVSVGASFQNYILEQISSFGGNTMDVFPKGLERLGKSLDTISFADAEAVKKLTTVTSVAPSIFVQKPVSYGKELRRPMVIGTNMPHFFANYGLEMAAGRLIDEQDEVAARNVAVVSYETANDLFPAEDPLGKRITVGNRKFTVIGVTKTVGSLLASDLDTPVYVPFTVAKAISGQTYVNYISLQAKENLDLAQLDVKTLLRGRHNIQNPLDDPDKDDFLVRTAAQAAEVIGTVTTGITAFLALVAGISLLVGGIGIMNIMLVSVSERTKEIGLRKALGAKRMDILLQFLIEAVSLTLVGGFIGVVGGIGIGIVLAMVANAFIGEFSFALSWTAILAAVGMALGTGLIFGIYPASRAARLSPMEALRYE